MKRFLFCAFVLVLCAAGSAMATYTIDFGTAAGETVAGVTLDGWGQREPLPAGHGNYGGFGTMGDNYAAPTTATIDHLCKMVWGGSEDAAGLWADVTFSTDISSVVIRHLDGSVGDDFDVHVDGVLWGHYTAGLGKTYDEQWFDTTFSGTAGKTLRITVTAPSTSWRDQGWGQLGIDRMTATPEPATICMLGLGCLFFRKRKSV